MKVGPFFQRYVCARLHNSANRRNLETSRGVPRGIHSSHHLRRLGSNNRGIFRRTSITLMQCSYCILPEASKFDFYPVDAGDGGLENCTCPTVEPRTRSSSKRTPIRNVNRGERQRIGTRFPVDSLKAGFRYARAGAKNEMPATSPARQLSQAVLQLLLFKQGSNHRSLP
jgi:hypothetical protein